MFNFKKINLYLFLPLLTITYFHSNIVTLLLMLFITFLYFKSNKKNIHFLYFLILLIYFLFSFINASFFKSLVPGDFNYNFLKELLYLVKYSMPFLFYMYIKNKKIEEYILDVWSVFIFALLFVTNIFKIAYSSYSGEIIKGNIFDWFFPDFTYSELASRGFFTYANQIALIVCLLSLYYIFRKKHLFLFLNVFSGILLATRISTFLPLILIILFSGYMLIVEVIKKKVHFNYYFKNAIIVLFLFSIIPISPQLKRMETYNMISSNNNPFLVASSLDVSKRNAQLAYIENNYKDKQINENFILNSYPYKYDPDFWFDIMQKPYSQRIDYRFLEISMVERVYEINNNKFDYLFGIGMTRIFNIWNIESDIVMQFYSFGLIGVLIAFYVYFVMIRDSIKVFIKKKKIENLYSSAIIILFLTISYLSGNILNSIPITLMSIVIFRCLGSVKWS